MRKLDMNKSFLSLLACVALVGCAPGPDGAVGAAGVQGAQGEQGLQGEPGAAGADAPTREGSVVAVSDGTVTAGSSTELHVLAQYTEWTEAPGISTDYEGLTVNAVVTSPVSMVITITAEPDVRGGEANLIVDGLQLTKSVEVIPAARFVPNEGQTNQVRPGQPFAGRIELASGFGFNGTVGIKTSESDESDERVVLTPIEDEGGVLRSFLFESRPGYGATAIILEGVVAPNTPSGVMNWRIENQSGNQIIPVYDALEIADVPAVDFALGGTVDASLEDGFGLFRLVQGEGGVIAAGTVVRVEALNADFPVAITASLPASGDELARTWTNTDTNIDITTNTVEFIAPRTAAYFVSMSHADSSVGAEFTYTASSEVIQMQIADGQPTEVTLQRPGHGAWFARSITAGQTLTWSVSPGQDSDYTPAFYMFRNFTDEEGADIFGQSLRIGSNPLITGFYLTYYGRGLSWPEAWGESLFIWRVIDASLGGGGGYTLTFTGNVQ